MKLRMISACVLVLLMIAVVVFNTIFPLALVIVVAVISALSVYEIVHALGLSQKLVLLLPTLLFAAVFPFLPIGIAQQIAYYIYTFLIFTSLICYHDSVTFREAGVIYSMGLMIPTALTALIQVRSQGGDHGMFYVIIAICSAWAADVGAFAVGSLLGKHKLCPNISPKKTIEGLVGGFVVDILAMLLFGFLFEASYHFTVSVDYGVLALLGFVSAGLSVIGDLSFSLIKRSCHIKDFSELIPGHGGMLDRFDSVIFVAPFVAFLTAFLPIVL